MGGPSCRPDRRVVIRPAVAADVVQVATIETACFADPWTEEAFHSSLAMSHFRFLVLEGEGDGEGEGNPAATGAPPLVGYVLAMVLGVEGEIADIAVSPAARGRGLGGLLLDRMMDDLADEGVRTVYLEVRESNLAARRLYESRGFGALGRRRGYYRHPPEDALVLRRDLVPA